jgi:hypothetical protein
MIFPHLKSRSNASERNSESLLLFLFHGTEFRALFSSAEWFGTGFLDLASIFVTRNGIPVIFLFREMVQTGISRVCFYFCSTVQNSRHFSLQRNGSERNSDVFFVPRNSRNSAGTNHRNCQPYFQDRSLLEEFLRKNPENARALLNYEARDFYK